MNPIDEVSVAKDILVVNTFSLLDRLKGRSGGRLDCDHLTRENVELGLIAIAATLQMTPTLRMQGDTISWDILIDALDHSVAWMEGAAQSLPTDAMAGELLELSEQFMALIAMLTGAWLWRQATISIQAHSPIAKPQSELPALSHAG